MKKLILLVGIILVLIISFIVQKPLETDLMKAFINPMSKEELQFVKLANISSKKLNIILESNSEESILEVKALFQRFVETNYKEIIDVYSDYAGNFLTEETRKLLKVEDYDIVANQALERVYNPFGIYIAPINKDPYLFATEFVLSKMNFLQDNDRKIGDKYYSLVFLDIKNKQDIEKIIEIQKQQQDVKIYLAGAPIHSHLMSQKSVLEINLICFLSTLALILLCKFYFKSFRIIIPIALSIAFGMFLGYLMTNIFFKTVHVLTFVFSTSLIGISLDYSLHYFLTGREKGFRQNLTSSMLTTVFAFAVLLFSDIEILRQIAVFTGFGLIGVYMFVIFILPYYNQQVSIVKLKPFIFPKVKWYFYVLIFLVIFFGFFKVQFDDNAKSLYVPPKKLIEAEKIYQDVFTPTAPKFLLIEGENADEILAKEEQLKIEKKICMSEFVSSVSKQKENINLLKELYSKNLEIYTKFIPNFSKDFLSEDKFKIYNPENFPMKKEFLIDDKTSYVIIFDDIQGAINPTEEMTKVLKQRRITCLKLLPVVFSIIFVLLSFIYGIKNSLRIIISPLCGTLFALGFITLLGGTLNLFHILALFLIIGFSLDYSIFRFASEENSKDAVFISCMSTVFSFGLLSLTSFKLISSLGTTLFLGILISYLLSLFVIKSEYGKKEGS